MAGAACLPPGGIIRTGTEPQPQVIAPPPSGDLPPANPPAVTVPVYQNNVDIEAATHPEGAGRPALTSQAAQLCYYPPRTSRCG